MAKYGGYDHQAKLSTITKELVDGNATSNLIEALSDPRFALNDSSFSSLSFPRLQPRTLLAFAACIRHIRAIELILQCSRLDVNRLSPSSSSATALFLAVRDGDLDDHAVDVIRSLMSHPEIDVNLPSDTSATPLHMACFRGNEKLVSFLLKHPRIDPSVVSAQGNEAIRMAVQQDHANVVRIMLSHPSVCVNKCDSMGQSHLGYAVYRGFTTVVAALLEQPDIDIHSPLLPFAQLTPLNYAREQVAKMFQQMGQNVLELSVQHGPEMAHILTLLEERVKKTTCSECGKTGTTTMLRCCGCRARHYCTKQCQERHWMKGHKRECSTLQRVSAANAAKVETEAREAHEKKQARKNAKASSSSSQATTRVACDFCYKEKQEKFLWCSGCKSMRYCSTECQKQAWRIGCEKSGGPHKKMCPLIREVKRLPTEHKDLEWMDNSGGWHMGVTDCPDTGHLAVWSLVRYVPGGLESNRFLPIGRRVVREGGDAEGSAEGGAQGGGAKGDISKSDPVAEQDDRMITMHDFLLMLFDSMLNPMRDALSQSGPRRPYKVTLFSCHLNNSIKAFDLTIARDLLYRIGVREVVVDDVVNGGSFYDSWYRVQHGLPITSDIFMAQISKERRVPMVDQIYFRAPIFLKRTKQEEREKRKNKKKEKKLRKMKKRVARLEKTPADWFVIAHEDIGIGVVHHTNVGVAPLGRATRPEEAEDFILAVVELVMQCALETGSRPSQLIVAQPEICSLKTVCRFEEWLNGAVATVCMGAHGSLFSGVLPVGLREAFLGCGVSS